MIAAVGELNSSLLAAARRNDSDEVRTCIEAGANLDVRDEDGWTPLMWAAMHQSLDMVELVVRHGANPSLLDEQGEAVEALSRDHLAVGSAVENILGANARMMAAAKTKDWIS